MFFILVLNLVCRISYLCDDFDDCSELQYARQNDHKGLRHWG